MGGTSDPDPLAVVTTPTSKRRRKKSIVWEHFTVEAVAGGCTRACCKQCKQTFAYSTGTKLAGTSHLKRHITMGSCPKIRQEKRQLALTSGSKAGEDSTDPPPKRRYRTSSLNFDQDRSSVDLAKMIIIQEYPLHMVEHPAFTSFIQGLQPRFKMPNLGVIEGEILCIYQKEKQNLTEFLGTVPGRVSLTIGLWTTSQTLGYICLTGHFIDRDWKLHRRMLNLMMVSSPHSENALSEVIGYSLSDWNMKTKLFTITLDNNCSSHDIYSANLRDHLSNKNTLMLKGQLFVVRCYAHILNVVAQDVIASIHGIVYNIRESLKYVKASLAHEERFAEIAQQLQIPSTKCLTLDVQMHWDTTYLMLVGALEFRHAFASLETCDPNYNEAPSSDDWRKVEIVCTYLRLLYDSANVVMGTIDPTANIYFHEAWKIQLELTHATASEDKMVSSIAREMHEKFDKYWKDCSLVLAVAVVMDPRFKMKLVEFSFTKIYGEDAARYIKVVDDAVHDLYLEYVSQPLPLTPAYVEQHGEVNNGIITMDTTNDPATIGAMDTNPYPIDGNTSNNYSAAVEDVTTTMAPAAVEDVTTTVVPAVAEDVTTAAEPVVSEDATTTAPVVTEDATTTAAPVVTEDATTTAAPASVEDTTTTAAPASAEDTTTTAAPAAEDATITAARAAAEDATTTVAPAAADVTINMVPAAAEGVTTTAMPASAEDATITSAPAATEDLTTSAPAATEDVTTTTVPVAAADATTTASPAAAEDAPTAVEPSVAGDVTAAPAAAEDITITTAPAFAEAVISLASPAATTTALSVSTPTTTANGSAWFGSTLSTGDGLLDFDIYISEMAVNQQTKSELDQYLEESLVPRFQEFDILNWWKLNSLKYPTLSKMARDVLAIPMSMLSTDSIFSAGTGSRMLDEYRSSLRPELVEALFCTKDWLQYVPTITEPPSTAIVKMEF